MRTRHASHRPSTARARPTPLRPFITDSNVASSLGSRVFTIASRSAFNVARLAVLAALSVSMAVRCAATCFLSPASLASAAFSAAVSSSLSSIRTSTCSSMRCTSVVKVAISCCSAWNCRLSFASISWSLYLETFCWAVAASFSSSRRAAWLSASAALAFSTAAVDSASCASSAAIAPGRVGHAAARVLGPGFDVLQGYEGGERGQHRGLQHTRLRRWPATARRVRAVARAPTAPAVAANHIHFAWRNR